MLRPESYLGVVLTLCCLLIGYFLICTTGLLAPVYRTYFGLCRYLDT